MINEETLTKMNKLLEMCENVTKTLEEHYRDLLEELDYIYAEIDDTLHSGKSVSRKKAKIVFDGKIWSVFTSIENRHESGSTGIGAYYDTLCGEKRYVDDTLIRMIEDFVSDNYEISFEYRT